MKVRSRKIKKNVQMLSTALVGVWIVFVGYATYNFSSIDYSVLLIVISIGIIIYLITILIKNFAYWIKEIIVKIDLGSHDDLYEPVKKPANTNTEAPPAERVGSRGPPRGGGYIGKAPLGLFIHHLILNPVVLLRSFLAHECNCEWFLHPTQPC